MNFCSNHHHYCFSAQAKKLRPNEEAQEIQSDRKVRESYTWGHTKIPAGAPRQPSGNGVVDEDGEYSGGLRGVGNQLIQTQNRSRLAMATMTIIDVMHFMGVSYLHRHIRFNSLASSNFNRPPSIRKYVHLKTCFRLSQANL